ncbi:hypothetical protein Tco_0558726, partial [Tanacetum coccineum]
MDDWNIFEEYGCEDDLLDMMKIEYMHEDNDVFLDRARPSYGGNSIVLSSGYEIRGSSRGVQDDALKFAQLVENDVVRVMIPKCMSWLDAYDEPIGDIEDKVDNPSPQSTPQVLPSIEAYIPPVTYPTEVDETIGIPMEVEPLDHTKLEDLGLNTCNHDIPLTSRGIPSVDELEPQLLPNFSPLDVNLEGKRESDLPINPYITGSFRMKVVKPLTIHTPPLPHVAYFHQMEVLKKRKNFFFKDLGDGVRINPDGVA